MDMKKFYRILVIGGSLTIQACGSGSSTTSGGTGTATAGASTGTGGHGSTGGAWVACTC